MCRSLILTSLFVLCVGCNDVVNDVNVRQQRAENARAQQTADDLRALGQAMHNRQSDEAAADAAATDAAKSASNVTDTAPSASDAAANDVDSSQ